MDHALPNFVIIGAMKCGTSTLHEQLARQPGIFMSEPKEPNYFSDDDVYAKGEAWYRGLFAERGNAALRGESSTHYTKLPTYTQTVTRMRALLPELKLIYVMRHPLDRLVSHYIHEWSMRVISRPIDEAVEHHPELLAYSCYHRQLTPFFEAYGRNNVLPVFLERVQKDSQSELERVCRFLGYSGKPQWVDDVAQQNVSSERLRLGGLGRKLFDDPRLAQLRRALIPQFVRDSLKARMTMKQRPELSPGKRAELAGRIDLDLVKLGEALGTPLSCASWKERVSEPGLDFPR